VEDILIIAMIRLWKGRVRFDPERASLRTYFARIADNMARCLISSGWAKTRQLEVPLDVREFAVASNEDRRDETSQDASLMHKLGQALDQLPEAYRTILLADACASGRVASAEFLSQELQIPAGTVRVYRHRAVTAVRRLLAEAGCKVP
jgi:RNA polymerase sigma factor (sigma-70 family)